MIGSLSLEQAFRLTVLLYAIAIGLQSLEMLKLRPLWSKAGPWCWIRVRDDFQFLPGLARKILDLSLAERPLAGLLTLALALSFIMPFWPHPLLVAIVFFVNYLTALRWRGSFNGGSDSMSLVVGGVLLLYSASSLGSSLREFALAYLAVQVSLSYFVAGWVKGRRREWWNGAALRAVLLLPRYAVPPRVQEFFSHGKRAQIASVLLLVFELAFPLALLVRPLTLPLVTAAFGFHLVNFVVFGLNRFFWIWISTYPALLWCSLHHFGT